MPDFQTGGAANGIPNQTMYLDPVFLLQLIQDIPDISVDADRLFFDLVRSISLIVVQAGIGGIRPLDRHLPESKFDYAGRVPSHGCLQEEHLHILMPAEEVGIAL